MLNLVERGPQSGASGTLAAPVLIVGGGPVGLFLGIELAAHGISSRLVEASDGTITFPTGESLSIRTMEHLRQHNLADAVRFSGFPPDYRRVVRFVTRVMGYQLTSFDRTGNAEAMPAETAVSPESSAWCPKFFLDPLLRARAESLPQVDVRFNAACEGLVQDKDGVTAEIRDATTGQTEQVRAHFLVGCDGGGSIVRRSAGIKLEGDYAQGQNLGIFFRAPTLLAQNPFGTASQYWLVNKDVRGPLSAVDGRERWRLSMECRPEEVDTLDPSELVRSAIGADVPFEILGVRPWAGHRVVAERYRAGRIFLAGDSAHMMWPRGGFGLNTGIGDAVNLAWKLAGTLQGWGGPHLLDSYTPERRPVGWRNVDTAAENRAAEAATPISPHLEEDSDVGAREREQAAAEIERLRRREWTSLGIQLGYRYDSSPICVPDGTPPLSDDPAVYEPSARPGSRAPHAWLADRRSTLDLFGSGYTLLRLGADAPNSLALESAAQRRGLPLTSVPIDDPAIASLYGGSLVLVRPDGHVAWRGGSVPGDPDALIDRVRGAGSAERRSSLAALSVTTP